MLREVGRHAAASGWGEMNVEELLGTDEVRNLEAKYLPGELHLDYDNTFGHRPGTAQGRPGGF